MTRYICAVAAIQAIACGGGDFEASGHEGGSSGLFVSHPDPGSAGEPVVTAGTSGRFGESSGGIVASGGSGGAAGSPVAPSGGAGGSTGGADPSGGTSSGGAPVGGSPPDPPDPPTGIACGNTYCDGIPCCSPWSSQQEPFCLGGETTPCKPLQPSQGLIAECTSPLDCEAHCCVKFTHGFPPKPTSSSCGNCGDGDGVNVRACLKDTDCAPGRRCKQRNDVFFKTCTSA